MTQISCREVYYVAVAVSRADAAVRFFRVFGTVVSLAAMDAFTVARKPGTRRSSRASRRPVRSLGPEVTHHADLDRKSRSGRAGVLLPR